MPLLRAGSKGIGEKTCLLCLLPSGLLGPELSQLGCAAPAPVTPTAVCASGLAPLPLPCWWHQVDLFLLPVLLQAQVYLEASGLHSHAVPGWLGLALLDWLHRAQGSVLPELPTSLLWAQIQGCVGSRVPSHGADEGIAFLSAQGKWLLHGIWGWLK